MSKLAEFRAAEKQLAEQLALLESLKNDSGL
ncbi:transcriptional regulator, partial [Pseudomonas sp. ATCC 13867]